MKVRSGFVSNSSSTSFLIAIHNENYEKFKEEFYASGDDGLYATIESEGREELLKEIDRRISRRWQNLFSLLRSEFKALEMLKEERAEIENYDQSWTPLEITYHSCYHRTGAIIEEYVKGDKLRYIKEV